MKIKEATNKKEWEDYVLKVKGSFLQSWQWGEFRETFQKVYRFGAYGSDGLVGVCQVFLEKLPFGSFLYVPYGPTTDSPKAQEELIERVKKLAKKMNSCFVRVESIKKLDMGKEAFRRHQPWKTLIVNLEKDDLLASFDKDTRYCVRRAKRENVKVHLSEDINSFYNLLKEASERHDFNTYSKEYFVKFLSLDFVELIMATHKSQPIAGALVSYFGDTAAYLHAGSDYDKRKLNAPSLISYKAMTIGQEKGCSRYDMWGIDEEEMPGVTRFKEGFNGTELRRPKAKDIPIKERKYSAYKLAYNKLRK